MGSTIEPPSLSEDEPVAPASPREELAALAGALRAQLDWHRRGGAYAAAGAPSPRTVSAVSAASGGYEESAAGQAVEAARVDEAAPARGDGRGGAEEEVAVRWQANAPAVPATAAVAHDLSAVAAPPGRSLAVIRAELGDCQRCKLCSTRKEIVFGVGPEPAPIMFIGEGPGEQEDRTGKPFVGAAGQLLDKMIEAMGWGRDDVYIANVVKCRPPGNRNPEADEIAACRPFLDAQIQAVRPRIIVTLGRPAANVVLGNNAPISSLRGKFHEHRGVRLMPTFHPAYLLRSPDKKRDAWSDLKQVIAELERIGVASPRPARA